VTPICPICKRPKIRRNGRYVCEQAYCRYEERQQEIRYVGKALNGEMSDEQWQQVINGQEPKERKR
jgi:uncharacterized Zn finger protein (UPF0148 family)